MIVKNREEKKRIARNILESLTDWFGVPEAREGKSYRKQLEIDFVVNAGNDKYYIQSALNTATEEKSMQEKTPLMHVKESFPKIIVQKDDTIPWKDEDGVLHVDIEQFLLERDFLKTFL